MAQVVRSALPGVIDRAHTSRSDALRVLSDRSELYDLMSDPHQLQNHVDNPAYARVVSDLKPRLQRLRGRGAGEKK
jgi:hypothetical protein